MGNRVVAEPWNHGPGPVAEIVLPLQPGLALGKGKVFEAQSERAGMTLGKRMVRACRGELRGFPVVQVLRHHDQPGFPSLPDQPATSGELQVVRYQGLAGFYLYLQG